MTENNADPFSLTGQLCLITGIARAFVAQGARVVITGQREELLAEAVTGPRRPPYRRLLLISWRRSDKEIGPARRHPQDRWGCGRSLRSSSSKMAKRRLAIMAHQGDSMAIQEKTTGIFAGAGKIVRQ